jgi:Tetracyclin repressor-like, C-terminal domain
MASGIMCYSASRARAAAIGQEQIEAHYQRTLTAALKGKHAAERAALVLAVVAGVQVVRQMIGISALARSQPDVLVEILGPIFELLLDGASPSRRRPSRGTGRPRRQTAR